MPRKTGWTNLEHALIRFIGKGPGYALVASREIGTTRSSATVALKRLEGMGIVKARWDTSEGLPGPPRRIYTLTAKGRRELAKLS